MIQQKILGRLLPSLLLVSMPFGATADDSPAVRLSYFRDVRPIFQAHCQGCHQPAKRGGGYAMTSYAELLKPGESETASIVPGDPDASYLVDLITPTDGEAEMPKGKQPLSQSERDVIRAWIEEGAHDDSPPATRAAYSPEHPPVYSRPPVITSIDYSPDGSLLAISGFHEVIVRTANGAYLVARLVGMSERIESARFSPDGKRIAVAAGNPSRSGEIQIWDVESRSLSLSIPLTFDTVYGVSWSPDAKMVVVGCSDSIVRGFDAQTGEQVFFNGAHDDWPLETVFSTQGSHIVSVGRDMSTKLYEVGTQRFVDNVTSITPAALKGGISALDRHPTLDQIAVGGSDGTPRIYRMERVTKRVIGDDANLLRRFPAMRGRVFGVSYSPDGKVIACGASLNGTGQVFTYPAEIDPAMPDDIKKIVETVVTQQNAEQKKQLEDYVTQNTAPLSQTELPASVYTVAFNPDGTAIAAAGADGLIRLINPADGAILSQFLPITVQEQDAGFQDAVDVIPTPLVAEASTDALPTGTSIESIVVVPNEVQLTGPYEYSQILVTGVLNTGDAIDLTRLVTMQSEGGIVEVQDSGRIIPRKDGTALISIRWGETQSEVSVSVSGMQSPEPVNFVRDVNPVLSRLGCNAGTCHGSKDGKNGFKLSLRGYDPILDARGFTDDVKSRRTNVASPADSLMLLKSTGSVPHVGGQITRSGEAYYEIIRRWIGEGAKLDLDVERVASISIEPLNPVVQNLGSRQQMRVLAHYSNGTTRDVTHEAYIESGNTEVAEVNRAAVVTAVRRGEAPILARYEGQYVATTLTAMGDRGGFAWQEPETWNDVDRFVAEKWERVKVLPSDLCSDDEFVRRVFLDLTGLPPSADEVQAFVTDARPTREKRDELIDRLVGSEAYIEYWTNKWADLLQVNRKFLGPEGAKLFRDWIRASVAENKPYDTFCHDILTATGSNKENPPASYYKILRDPDLMMENTTQLFLAVRFNCNKCHDHPFERWTQDQYYDTAAYFARVGLKRDPQNAEGNIGGTAVEGAKPLWEVVFEKDSGEVVHDRTGAETPPRFPYDESLPIPSDVTRREQLADWITSPENDYFAKSYVNRIWGYLTGVGLIEPLDDIRAGNPPSNPQLLNWLTAKFIESGFNVQELMKTICKSRTYQLSVATNEWNADDTLNYAHALPKRLPAEVLYDAVYTVTGSAMKIPGVPEGTRAAALPDAGVSLEDGFLANLGRPARESACECERASGLQLGPVMALMNGPTISGAISQSDNAIAQLASEHEDLSELTRQIFLRVLNREPRPVEVATVVDLQAGLRSEHEQLTESLRFYEEQIAPTIAKQKAKRESAIQETESAIAARTEAIRPQEEAAEQARQEKIAVAKHAVEAHLATASERAGTWEQTALQSQTGWTALDFDQLKTTSGAKLEKQDDLSVFASGPNNRKGAYVVSAQTDLQQITAIKLEVLTDDRLANKGPGRSPNGNFVLSELTMQAWPADKPDEKQTIKLQNAKADFAQEGFPIETAIDGKQPNNGNGWATHPKTGQDRVATFELAEPLNLEAGAVLHFTLDQNYLDNKHSIGKFRISVTTGPTPVNFGHPERVVAIVNTPKADRTEEQQAKLIDYFNEQDSELHTLQQALAEAEKPRPDDPELVKLREELKLRQQPVPDDPQLVRLRRAVELSQQQLQNDRLTVAQDLTWALVNSPAFLFNH